jgi:hypothetical protein
VIVDNDCEMAMRDENSRSAKIVAVVSNDKDNEVDESCLLLNTGSDRSVL